MVSKMLVFVLIVGAASAATFIGKVPPKPQNLANQDGCYVEEINEVIAFGASITPIGQCYGMHCSRNMIEYASCGVVSTDDPKCYVTDVDLSKAYPSCCPNVKCDLDNIL